MAKFLDLLKVKDVYRPALDWAIIRGHTVVLGANDKLGYGGKCFPKDVNVLTKMTVGCSLNSLLASFLSLNVVFRGEEI